MIYKGDALEVLRTLPDESVQMCVTSPPYYGLRDYGIPPTVWGGDPSHAHDFATEAVKTEVGRGNWAQDVNGRGEVQPDREEAGRAAIRSTVNRGFCECGAWLGTFGLEPTPALYVEHAVSIFEDVRRVLKPDGVLWLNLGDSYATGAGQVGGHPGGGKQGATWAGRGDRSGSPKHTDGAMGPMTQPNRMPLPGLKPKDLVGIPWRVAFALQASGWVLRQEIVWSKPNPMPESVGDRCTKSHETIFMFAKARWSGPEPGRFAHISDADARWLALLVDAEGCIVVKRVKHEGRGDTFAPQVSIGNTSEALMREVVRIVGHGSLLERPGKNCRMLYWQLSSGVATDFLRRIYPFLIVKQRQARIGIYLDSLTYYRGGKKKERKERSASELAVLDSLWARSKQCNRFGQPDLSDVPEPVFGRWSDCERYFYDSEAIKEPGVYAGPNGAQKSPHAQGFGRRSPEQEAARQDKRRGHGRRHAGFNARWDAMERAEQTGVMRNKRSVWNIATKPFTEWGETSRRVHVALDAIDGDTKRTTSPDCPVHGDHAALVPNASCGEREGASPNCTGRTSAHPVQEPLADSAPTGSRPAPGSLVGSSDSSLPEHEAPATSHSNGNRKRGRAPATIPPCTPSEQTPERTERTEEVPASLGSAGHTSESSTEPVGSGDHPSVQTASRTGDSLSCSCDHYRIVTEQISHFATFPEEIPMLCILAGSRPGDVVLDPFNGAGTTGVVCEKTGRSYIGIELNPAYVEMARRRIANVAPLFNQPEEATA